MNVSAAENHYTWRADIGHSRKEKWPDTTQWSLCGHGCIVHPRIALTSMGVLKRAQDTGGYVVSLRSGKSFLEAKPGRADKERGLALLVSGKHIEDRDGRQLASFPTLADSPPEPGQALGIITEQHLVGSGSAAWGDNRRGGFLCYTYGSVALLRHGSEVLYALSGIVTDEQHTGKAVFDEHGRIVGVITDYLRHDRNSEHLGAPQGASCFIVFSPVYKMSAEVRRITAAESQGL